MSQSPAKRRKLSPEPRLDATTPTPRYPSFASPTRASISRVAPQILERRGTSMENDAPPTRRGALARTPVQENLFVTQSSQGASQEQNTPSRPVRRSPRSAVRGGMTSAPRRPSRSPQKPTPRAPDIFDEPPPDPVPIDLGQANPFQKRSALRRSPPGNAPPVIVQQPAPFAPEAQIDPFKRGGLRRSGGGIVAAPAQNAPARIQPVVEAEAPTQPAQATQRTPAVKPVVTAAVAEEPERAEPPSNVPPSVAPVERNDGRAALRTQRLRGAQTRSPGQVDFGITTAVVEERKPAAALSNDAPASVAPAVERNDGRAALRNQRLRGAQTRSPGQVDFGFNIPAPITAMPPPPQPPVQTRAPPIAPSPLPAQPQPVADIAPAPTPTLPLPQPSLAAESPLFVSQTSNSPLPALDSSIIATPTPAPAPRTSRATEKQSAQPERAQTRVSEAAPEEPELPPTPTQRGIADPIVTTPPTGIHNTPSKRLKRRMVHQSSPLKPRPEHRSEPSDDAEADSEPANKRQRADPPSRFTHVVDPHAEKRRKRDRMLAEIRQLESDIKLAERENERVRRAAVAGKDAKRPANADAIVEMLSRTMAAPSAFEAPPKNPPSILDKVNLFLPFSRPPRPKERSVEEIIKTGNLPSALPVEMDNPLPFLSVFTPFKFSSTITTLPPTPGAETGEADILQLYNIVTTAPNCLFGSKLSITVNTRSGNVDRCDIDYLEPAAEQELGPWIRKRAQGGALGRDINSIYWASSQWYECAVKRAKFWCQVEAELGDREGRERARRRLRAEARRGRRPQPGVPQEPEEHFEEEEEGKWTPEQVRRNMGRRRAEIEIEGVKLVIGWEVQFDWTGEARQTISATVKAPRRWHEMDERKQLDRIPEIFQGLVRERSHIVAARTVVVLLMGE